MVGLTKIMLMAAVCLPGCATRSYLFVEDVAEAFDVILHRGVVGEVRLIWCITILKARTYVHARPAHHCAEEPFGF